MVAAANPSPTTRPRWVRAGCTAGVVLTWLSLTYVPHLGLWLAPLGTLVMVGLGWVAWGSAGPVRLGLCVPRRAAAAALALLVVTAAVAWWLVTFSASVGGVTFHQVAGFGAICGRCMHTAGQTGNEEIVLGALLLGTLTRARPRLRPLTISILVAAAFAALHYAFYAFRPEDACHHGRLSLPTLVAVLAVGVLRNNLILAHGHIGYAWAVHLGWNLFFMGGRFADATTGVTLNEPERFNLVLGHPLVAALTVVAASVTAWHLGRCDRGGMMATCAHPTKRPR